MRPWLKRTFVVGAIAAAGWSSQARAETCPLTEDTLKQVCTESGRELFLFGDIGPDVTDEPQGCCCVCDSRGDATNLVDGVRACNPDYTLDKSDPSRCNAIGEDAIEEDFRLEVWVQGTTGAGSCERDCYRAFGQGGTLTDRCLEFCRSQ